MPYIIVLEALTYLYLCVVYFGMFRRNSAAAKATKISQQAKIAAKKVIDEEAKKLGKITFWEVSLKVFPNIVVLLIIIMCVIFATNFATNVVIANVFVPIAIQLAKVLNQNPLWYTIAAGYTASWAFMIPVGTPPNLIIASAARISTKQMDYQWVAYTLMLMAVYWVTECVPLPITSFLPVLIFPMAGVMNTSETCNCYLNVRI
ncbi:putative sodium/dicarboxylate cotransporter, partial [Operophtera brumata]